MSAVLYLELGMTQPKDLAESLKTIESHSVRENFAHSRSDVSRDDYRDLVHTSSARIACFEFATPLPRKLGDVDVENSHSARLWSVQSACIESNKAFAAAYGDGSIAATLGRSLRELLPPARGFDILFRSWKNLACSNSSFEANVTTRLGNSESLQVVVYAKGATDLFSRIWIVMRDVTIHSRRLRDIIEAERHYRSLLERPGLILVRVNPSGRYDYISPSIQSILGVSKDDLNRDPAKFMTLLHPDDVGRFDLVRAARQERRTTPLETEYRLRLTNGDYHTFFVRQTAKLSLEGEVEYFDLIAVDVEEQRQLQRQANHAQRLDMVGSLAAGIAHDVNNHLTAILGQLGEGLSTTPPDHPVFERLQAAQRAALQCTDLSRQLLQLGRKEAEQVMEIDPDVALRESLDLVRHIIPMDVQILVRSTPGVPRIRANPTQFHQLVMNLVMNARDSMPNGGVLTITLREVLLKGGEPHLVPQSVAAGNYVACSVEDSGCGIAPEMIEKIFEPFFTTKATGNGLGLATVYSIVKTHLGAVSVESEPGRGTKFIVFLPTCIQSDEQVEGETSSQSTLRGVIEKETILIAEDDDLVRSMLASVLKARGYHVISAGNGQEAVDLYQHLRDTVCAIVLDENMPKLLGREAAKKILTNNPNARVLITSGYGKFSSDFIGKTGSVEFLSKPYSLDDLFQALDRMTH